MPDLGIIFQFHQDLNDEVVRTNLSSLVHYSKYPIILIKRTEGQSVWYHGDLGMYHWYQQRNVECARWLYLEWDTYCCQSIDEFFKPIWDADMSGPNLALPNTDWHWFCDKNNLPTQELRDNSHGLWPLCGVMMSDKVLNTISKIFTNEQPWGVFSEYRIATAAKINGFILKEHPYSKYHLRWKTEEEIDVSARNKRVGIWHPVKFAVQDDIPKCDIKEMKVFVWPKE